MRSAVLLSGILIADAINPDQILSDSVVSFFVAVIVSFIVADAIDFFNNHKEG